LKEKNCFIVICYLYIVFKLRLKDNIKNKRSKGSYCKTFTSFIISYLKTEIIFRCIRQKQLVSFFL